MIRGSEQLREGLFKDKTAQKCVTEVTDETINDANEANTNVKYAKSD